MISFQNMPDAYTQTDTVDIAMTALFNSKAIQTDKGYVVFNHYQLRKNPNIILVPCKYKRCPDKIMFRSVIEI